MKYLLSAHVTVTAYLEVEASSAAEAIALGEAQGSVMLAREAEIDEAWIIQEADGTPLGIKVAR